MARLTRTAKYAALREQLSQDREETIKTNDLKEFADKLNTFTNESDVILKSENPKPQTEVKVAPANNEMKSLDSILASMMEDNFTPERKEESKETIDDEIEMIDNLFSQAPVSQKEAIQEEVSPSIDSFINNIEEQKQEPAVSIDSFINNIEEQKQEPAVSIDSFINNLQEEPKQDISIDSFINNIEEEPNTTTDFLSNTLNEVNNYNKESGKTTLSDLSNTLIDQIRHPEKTEENVSNGVEVEVDVVEEINEDVVQELIKEEPPQISIDQFVSSMVDETKEVVEEEKEEEVKLSVEDEFANTVSLEISKVLEEIKNQNDNTVEVALQEVQAAKVNDEPVLEHPVLAQSEEEAEPVLIKNLNETLNINKTEDVLDDTIPFDVEAVKPVLDEDDDDEYEDEAPSKVLNVILGILIFVLVAVLGVIVYYILIAKGIIG